MRRTITLGAAAALLAGGAAAQTAPPHDPVLQSIWQEGMERSQLPGMAQVLTDSIGPRLTGSPGMKAGNDWLLSRYRAWGIPARNEQYGTWKGWRRGVTHLDLLQPRVRTLEATMLAWSPGTSGPVTGAAIRMPRLNTPAALAAWLAQARGKFVALVPPQPTCRPDENWEKWATPESRERLNQERAAALAAWREHLSGSGAGSDLVARLEAAGVAGILTSTWSRGWGVNRIFDAETERTPMLDLSCEDYGLVYRLAQNEQGPVLRLDAEAESLGQVPVFNTVAEIRGSETPDEYVVLSAHFDSWDGASGATDNGTGTITMLEAMRILRQVYPRPKRTLLVGHWGGEEQGLNGSRAFAADHPEIVQGLQVLLNQDNGTGRTVAITMQGFARAGDFFRRWLARVPAELTREIDLRDPAFPGGGGSDYASFVCHGAPAFSLSALEWDYSTYTWHTNRDTYDKIVFDDVRKNATLAAMLAYLASEDPERMPRDRAVLPNDQRTGRQMVWPTCREPARTSGN